MNVLAWANHLPETWELKPLRSVADYAISNVDKVSHESEIPVRLCNYRDVYYNDFITRKLDFMPATASESEVVKFALSVDDVLITKDSESPDDIGVPALVREHIEGLVCGYHLAVLRPHRGKLLGPFLFRCLQARSVRVQVELASNGITRYGIPKSAIGSIRLPVPPLEEQRLIVAHLNRETGRLDALVAEKKRMAVLLEDKRKGLVTRFLTRGLNAGVSLRDSGIPWLGSIPQHWSVIQLKYVSASMQTGPFGSQLHARDYVSDGIPLVNPSNLSNGQIDAISGFFVDEATASRLDVHRLCLGDIVFARRGRMGMCGVVEPRNVGWLCGTGSLRVRLNNDVAVPEYIAFLFSETRISDFLADTSIGSTMDNLNTEILGGCHVPVPPVDEQHAIVERIADDTVALRAIYEATSRSIALVGERRSAVIGAAVTGMMNLADSP